MTDNEIIKALEECIELRFDDETEYVTVRLDTLTNALDLIKRQQSEIERLNSLCASKDVIINSQEAENEKLKHSPIISSLCPMWKAEARVETIKEFANSLFRKSQLLASSVYGTPERGVFMKDIESLVIEMIGKEV